MTKAVAKVAKAPTSKDGKPICVDYNEVGHDQSKCPKPRMDAKDRNVLRCDKPGHRAAQCKSGLPFKEVGVEENEEVDYTLTVCAEVECWTAVENNNRYPHVDTSMVNFEHGTAFQFSNDSSEDSDREDDLCESECENEQHNQHP